MATASFCLLFASLFSPVAVPSDPAAAALVAALAVSHILPNRDTYALAPRRVCVCMPLMQCSVGLVNKAFQLFMPGNWVTLALTVFTLPLSLTPDAFARATAEVRPDSQCLRRTIGYPH